MRSGQCGACIQSLRRLMPWNWKELMFIHLATFAEVATGISTVIAVDRISEHCTDMPKAVVMSWAGHGPAMVPNYWFTLTIIMRNGAPLAKSVWTGNSGHRLLSTEASGKWLRTDDDVLHTSTACGYSKRNDRLGLTTNERWTSTIIKSPKWTSFRSPLGI